MLDTIKKHPVLGSLKEDEMGKILNTGYVQFESPSGIFGLCKFTDERLDLLVVIAHKPESGQFKRFVTLTKKTFKTICVWEIWNETLKAALDRYEFKPETELQGDGEVLHGMRWDKEASR